MRYCLAFALTCLLASLGPAAPSWAAGPQPKILFDPVVSRDVRLPDFSYAGYGFGEVALPKSSGTVIDVTRFGAVADDGRDDSAAVLAALAKANEVKGPVVLRFPAGRFILSEVLLIERSHLVMEGAGQGAGGTELHFPRPLRMVDKSNRLASLRAYLKDNDKRQVEPAHNINEPFSPYSWSGGFIWSKSPKMPADTEYATANSSDDAMQAMLGVADAQELTVREGAGIRVGDVITIRWYSRDGRASALLRSIYGDQTTEIGSRLWESPERAIVKQTTRVTRVDAGRIRIADKLLHDIGADMPADIVQWQGLTEIGIRDLALSFPAGTSFGHHLEEGWNGICLTDVFNGWVSSVRISNADSGILIYNSASLTIRNITTEGERRAHYSVHVGSAHNVLVSELQVFNSVVHSLSFNTLSTRSVFQRASVFKDPVLDQHAGGNHQNLYDDLRLYINASPSKAGPTYALWDGSGATYWQPGHGRFNTHWNIQVIVISGASTVETVTLNGLDEGPDARVVGISGNRDFRVDYRPVPYVEMVNSYPRDVPSLYDWQLSRRLKKN
ncbi:MAG: glycosyl hydrolase family 28-related protein [Thermomonas sp.]